MLNRRDFLKSFALSAVGLWVPSTRLIFDLGAHKKCLPYADDPSLPYIPTGFYGGYLANARDIIPQFGTYSFRACVPKRFEGGIA